MVPRSCVRRQGIEPRTRYLKGSCSATELAAQFGRDFDRTVRTPQGTRTLNLSIKSAQLYQLS